LDKILDIEEDTLLEAFYSEILLKSIFKYF